MRERRKGGFHWLAAMGCFLLLVSNCLAGTAHAFDVLKGKTPEGPRLGPLLGDPIGAVFGIFLMDNLDLQSGLGYDLSDGFLWFADCDFHLFVSDNPEGGLNSLSPYFGLGVGAGFLANPSPFDDDSQVNLRFPIGCSYLIPNFSGYVFAQVVVEAEFLPDTGAGVSGGAGFQFLF